MQGATVSSVFASKAAVEKVYLRPGEATPIRHDDEDYLVYPLAAARVLLTIYRDGELLGMETTDQVPGEPYFVHAGAANVTSSLKNVGDGPMMFDKTLVPAIRPAEEPSDDAALAASALYDASAELSRMAAGMVGSMRARADQIDDALALLRAAAAEMAAAA